MPTFSYRALQADGKFAEGALDAAGRADALRQIETLGLRPVNVAEKTSKAGKNGSATTAAPAAFDPPRSPPRPMQAIARPPE